MPPTLPTRDDHCVVAFASRNASRICRLKPRGCLREDQQRRFDWQYQPVWDVLRAGTVT